VTYILTIIAFNFWFFRPGSQIAFVSWIDRPIDLLRLPWPPLPNLPLPFFLFVLSMSSTLLRISRTILLWKKCLCTHVLFNLIDLFPYGFIIFPWDLVLKEHPYFATPLSGTSHNRTFAVSVRSFLSHVFLASSPNFFSFNCI